jgi:D-amino-acid oxidase
LSRTKELLPVLGDLETEVLAVVSGLRPSREGGARVEAESQVGGRLIVHNYGAGGTGYQAGMGMAMDAVNLFTESAVTLPLRAVI